MSGQLEDSNFSLATMDSLARKWLCLIGAPILLCARDTLGINGGRVKIAVVAEAAVEVAVEIVEVVDVVEYDSVRGILGAIFFLI